MLEVHVDHAGQAYAPGETLHAQVRWSLASPPRAIHLELRWETEGKGTSDSEVVASEKWTGLSASEERQWSVVLPRGPESMQGQLIRIQWSLRCWSDGSEPISVPLVVSRIREPIRPGVSNAWQS
ncbi:MAG: hypothetical protein ACK6DC_20645 [Planctomycetota bacterium]|jgi:hypothetical protein